MAHNVSYSTLEKAAAYVNSMLVNGFGVVTVMNAKIYDNIEGMYYKAATEGAQFATVSNDASNGTKVDFSTMKVDEIVAKYETLEPLCYLETLKTSTINTEGPSKTITGGQYGNALIKFGKTARLEMQDALGNGDALAAMTGTLVEDFNKDAETNTNLNMNTMVLHIGSQFSGQKTIIGDTFFVDYKTGAQVKLKLIFYAVIPDSTFSLNMEADGDGAVFDMNGDLQTTDILVGVNGKTSGNTTMGVFCSVIPAVWTETQKTEETE